MTADRDAPIRFLRTVFEPTDWVAIFLKSYAGGAVAQRVGPLSWVESERCQRWLRAMNAQKFNVFVSVNAITAGRRSRTRDAVGSVRHLFLDADDDGLAVLCRIEARRDLPCPSYVLHSSPNHVHIFWRVGGFCCRLIRGFALTDEQALTALAEWNSRCQPPWSPEELLNKLRRAARYGREPVGGLL
jgi:hypothetical protein